MHEKLSFADDHDRAATTTSLVFAAVFASLVFLNYTFETTFVPGLLRHYEDSNAPIVAALSMTNPASLAAFAMWNVLVVVMAVLALVVFHRRTQTARGEPERTEREENVDSDAKA